MRKSCLLVSLLIFVIALSACKDNTTIDNKIVVWHDKEEAVVAVLENAILVEYPDLEIEFVRKESLTDTLKIVGNNSNSAPDMYIFAHDKIGLFAEIGILEPITEFIDIATIEGLVDLTVDAATYKDEMYQLPLYYETLLFMYNRDRLTDEEVPTTTDDLLTYMEENTDSRRYAFVEQHSNAYYSAGWINGFGGTILNDDGTPGLDSEETRNALEYHLQFIQYMPQGQAEYATINTLFYEKKANSIIAGPWIVPEARDRGIDLGFASMPIINETGTPISPYAGIQGIHVLQVAVQNDEMKENITNVLSVLSSTEVGVQLALASGVAPANENAYLDERVTEDELVMAMRDAAESSVPMPNLPEMDIMWLTASNMLVEINMKGADIDEATSESQEESEGLIDLMD